MTDERHEKLRRIFDEGQITVFSDETNHVAVWYGGTHISVYDTRQFNEVFVTQGLNRSDVDESDVEEALKLGTEPIHA